MTHRRVLLAAGLGFALWACQNDVLNSPSVSPYGAMFQRYVAMGNSVTAGVQSAGINDSTQRQSYAALIGNVMRGDRFYYPSLNPPGCPPPLTNIFTGARVGGAGVTSTTCALRNAALPPYVSDVAVPGAETVDMLTNGTPNSNPLTQLFLGGRTQVQAMMDARPTFVSVWAGNNDLLAAAEAGDTTLATDTTAFRTSYAHALDSIAATGAQAILIAVGLGHLYNNVVLPFFSRGTTWFGAISSGAFAPAPLSVAANCAPPRGDTVLVSFAYGFGLVARASQGIPTTLDCAAPPVVEPAETRFLTLLQVKYNAIIQAEATARGFAYTDSVNFMMDSLAAVPPAGSQFRPFPAVGAACSASPFGLAFSCDGIHPSQGTQLLIARKIVRAINAKYNTTISTP
ncbi:MAG TPA: hypothetical protein VJN39_05025 [Gemmatimonadales bacterium]|nr:hypothetical protein [Gemmatimonadales bacterium]